MPSRHTPFEIDLSDNFRFCLIDETSAHRIHMCILSAFLLSCIVLFSKTLNFIFCTVRTSERIYRLCLIDKTIWQTNLLFSTWMQSVSETDSHLSHSPWIEHLFLIGVKLTYSVPNYWFVFCKSVKRLQKLYSNVVDTTHFELTTIREK